MHFQYATIALFSALNFVSASPLVQRDSPLRSFFISVTNEDANLIQTPVQVSEDNRKLAVLPNAYIGYSLLATPYSGGQIQLNHGANGYIQVDSQHFLTFGQPGDAPITGAVFDITQADPISFGGSTKFGLRKTENGHFIVAPAGVISSDIPIALNGYNAENLVQNY